MFVKIQTKKITYIGHLYGFYEIFCFMMIDSQVQVKLQVTWYKGIEILSKDFQSMQMYGKVLKHKQK